MSRDDETKAATDYGYLDRFQAMGHDSTDGHTIVSDDREVHGDEDDAATPSSELAAVYEAFAEEALSGDGDYWEKDAGSWSWDAIGDSDEDVAILAASNPEDAADWVYPDDQLAGVWYPDPARSGAGSWYPDPSIAGQDHRFEDVALDADDDTDGAGW